MGLFRDRFEIPTKECMAFARARGWMLTILTDDINDKAIEIMGDNVLREEGEVYLLSDFFRPYLSNLCEKGDRSHC